MQRVLRKWCGEDKRIRNEGVKMFGNDAEPYSARDDHQAPLLNL
jgi:hypothetical protein